MKPLVRALLISNGVSLLLFCLRVFGAESYRFSFLLWNLFLAAVPLVFAAVLVKSLATSRWFSAKNIILTFLWLGFLPNSFYIVTDLIHVHLTGEINILFDVVMMMSFIFNGFVFGYLSLYAVHRQLLKRMARRRAHGVVAIIFVACSFAIYLGRFMRWNTWDILAHPWGILFDVTDRLVSPLAHPQAFTTTFTFTVLLGSIYMVVWEFVRLLRKR
jgi:uncharacterized membrane protein